MTPLPHADSHGHRTRRFALTIGWLFAACSTTEPQPQVIWLTPPQAPVLTVSDTLAMTATIQGRPCECRWSSADLAVASVSPDGLVRAVAPGYTTITATLVRDSNTKNSVLIVVAARERSSRPVS